MHVILKGEPLEEVDCFQGASDEKKNRFIIQLR